jgi:hypothetical protein
LKSVRDVRPFLSLSPPVRYTDHPQDPRGILDRTCIKLCTFYLDSLLCADNSRYSQPPLWQTKFRKNKSSYTVDLRLSLGRVHFSATRACMTVGANKKHNYIHATKENAMLPYANPTKEKEQKPKTRPEHTTSFRTNITHPFNPSHSPKSHTQ